MRETMAVGSLGALGDLVASDAFDLESGSDVVVVATAAAFVGAERATLDVAELFASRDVAVEALMNIDRHSSDEPYFARRVREADLVVLVDGSPLHAKSVWHGSAVGEAIRDTVRLVAVGSVASVLGATMIDPRGGAPTTGLGYRDGLVIGVVESPEKLTRTRALLGPNVTFALLGPRGVVRYDGERWRVVSGDVIVTRGEDVVGL